jgi:DNA-binding PadR family transcriptional regulator
MSIRHGVLALLGERPRYGYEVRTAFEARMGGTWSLNVGQVYTTLSRLERDGLVEAAGEDEAGHQYYAITAAGREELHRWFTTPVRREDRPRDELAIKLALAVAADDLDVAAVLQAQRSDSLRALQEYTRLKVAARPAGEDPADLAWQLVLEAMIFQAEAEVRWLDHCESRLLRARPDPGPPSSPRTAAPRPARTVAR